MSILQLSPEMIKKLIICVKERRYLWDVEDSSHKEVHKLAKGWTEIAKEMKMPMRIARSKWKNLKDIYRRQMRKYPDLSSPEEYKGRWKYFKSLSFLFKRYKPTETQYYWHDVNETTYADEDDDNKAFIFKVGPDHVENGDDSSDKHDEDFDNDSEPQTKKTKSDDDDDDYDIMFLKSLAPYMRSLSPVQKLEVRNEIQQIFLQKIRK